MRNIMCLTKLVLFSMPTCLQLSQMPQRGPRCEGLNPTAARRTFP